VKYYWASVSSSALRNARTGDAHNHINADASLASLVTLALGRFLIGFAGTVFTIHHVSLRQAITPDRVQGRMNATVRFIAGGVVPLGALVGGAIGTAYGVRAALLVGAVGAASAFMWLWASPVRALRSAELLTDAQ
jgi:MFS family permease